MGDVWHCNYTIQIDQKPYTLGSQDSPMRMVALMDLIMDFGISATISIT